MTEDEKVGWHHRLNGHEYEHSPGATTPDASGSESFLTWAEANLATTSEKNIC